MTVEMPILVPLDDPDDLRAVEYAHRLAGMTDGGVRVLSVVGDPAMVGQRAGAISDAVRRIDEAIDVRVVVHDAIASAIVESAVSSSAVCMTTAATLRPHEGHFGSIAEAVVRSLGRSVLLLGPGAPGFAEATARLVIPLDGSEASEHIIEDAGALARALGAEIWVVTVATPQQERNLDAVAGPEFAVLESGYVRRVAKQISAATGTEAQFEVLHHSNPARAILEFAGDDGLIAMSTHGRSGLRRIFAGSVTTEVVAGAKQPVLVVRPPDHTLLFT